MLEIEDKENQGNGKPNLSAMAKPPCLAHSFSELIQSQEKIKMQSLLLKPINTDKKITNIFGKRSVGKKCHKRRSTNRYS